jgi:hypothetical protein
MGIGTKDKWRYVISLAKLSEIAKKFLKTIYLFGRGHHF